MKKLIAIKEKKNGFQNQANEPGDSPQVSFYAICTKVFKPFCLSPLNFVQRRDGRIRQMRLAQDQMTPQVSRGFKSPSSEDVIFPLQPHKVSFFVILLFGIISATNVFAAQDFIIENRTASLFVVNGTTGNIVMAPSFGLVGILILGLVYVLIINKKEKRGFLNLNDDFPKTKAIYISNYLNLLFLCKAAEAQLGRALSYQLGVFPKDMRVQNSQPRVESPVRGALKNVLLPFLALILSIRLFSTPSLAAQDFIIENKTAALFVVNGTTGNIIMAPSLEMR